jgi:hypothetical protein
MSREEQSGRNRVYPGYGPRPAPEEAPDSRDRRDSRDYRHCCSNTRAEDAEATEALVHAFKDIFDARVIGADEWNADGAEPSEAAQ